MTLRYVNSKAIENATNWIDKGHVDPRRNGEEQADGPGVKDHHAAGIPALRKSGLRQAAPKTAGGSNHCVLIVEEHCTTRKVRYYREILDCQYAGGASAAVAFFLNRGVETRVQIGRLRKCTAAAETRPQIAGLVWFADGGVHNVDRCAAKLKRFVIMQVTEKAAGVGRLINRVTHLRIVTVRNHMIAAEKKLVSPLVVDRAAESSLGTVAQLDTVAASGWAGG
jgi:hypothetical protein